MKISNSLSLRLRILHKTDTRKNSGNVGHLKSMNMKDTSVYLKPFCNIQMF